MYFIEQLFGLSPDGDSGSLELLLVLVPLVVILAGAVALQQRMRSERGGKPGAETASVHRGIGRRRN
jgi:hypothetical protein